MKEKHARLFLKRIFDILVSAALLIVLSPLLLAIALAIRLTCGSPILYEWRVIGLGERPFVGHKFRTMVLNADQMKSQLMDRNEMNGGPVFKIKDDPRVTPVGRILRKFSLDELPQLWSVLKGDMSIVGPRPPLLSEYAQFEEWQKHKLAMKPGMTCLWQVRGKPANWHEWLRLDFEYIDHWSLRLDLKILWQTVIVVLTGKNF
jgi:lipopolysaccharide/colanic/teichoic acid biosynthesis glycosyltransferase